MRGHALPAPALEPGVLDLGGPAIAEAVLARDRGHPTEADLVVGAGDGAWLVDGHDLPALEQHRAVAEALDRAHVVRDEDDRLAGVLEAVELVEALLLEGDVADGEDL